jgi:hypothetical protein
MKKGFMTLAAFLVLWGTQSQARESVVEKEVTVGINGAYIPAGFDSASDAYVVVNGVFQNGCYKWKRAEINNKDSFTHEVVSIASVSQGMCLMVLVPFQKEIRMGQMASGNHTIRFLNGDGTYLEKSMIVE